VRVTVVGGTGLIGRRLASSLAEDGHEATAVSRGAAEVEGARHERWDPANGPIPDSLLDGRDAVVNLAGAPIQGGRWTEGRKRVLWDSRVATTQRVVEALPGSGVRTLVNASAVGFYGPRGDEEVTEATPQGTGFLSDLCAAWEGAARQAESRAGARVARLRTGVVLAAEGGALPVMARPVRLFVGGPLGSGRQWIPWIHVDDVVGLIRTAISDGGLAGPVNVVGPAPERQRDVVRAIGDVLGRPTVVPAPAFAVKAALGEMATVALDGQRAVPAAAERAGYAFAFPELVPALQSELG